VLDVEGFPIVKDWFLVHRRGKRFSTAAAAFKDFVLQESSRIIKIPQAEGDA
jgi:hypothetical protein